MRWRGFPPGGYAAERLALQRPVARAEVVLQRRRDLARVDVVDDVHRLAALHEALEARPPHLQMVAEQLPKEDGEQRARAVDALVLHRVAVVRALVPEAHGDEAAGGQSAAAGKVPQPLAASEVDAWLAEMRFESSAGREPSGYTPLRFAALSGRVDLAVALIERGADLEAPLARANAWLALEKGMAILHHACMSGCEPSMAALLLAYNVSAGLVLRFLSC